MMVRSSFLILSVAEEYQVDIPLQLIFFYPIVFTNDSSKEGDVYFGINH